MDLDKITYVDGSTVITAQNLNDIQDAIIDLEQNRSVPTSVREAIYTLLENAAYITTGLDDELAVVEAWAEQVYSLTLNKTTLELEEDTPQTITATVVPADAAVSWSSSDDDIATVNAGVVTGVSNGTCVITATAGALSATCNVTVSGFVELVSISAVYTQSGTVYDTDSLDSLKADLVVTATYSDSSTATIPSTDYILSGTLTAGTSTITVVYGGKTTTFNVTVTAYLPTGYTKLTCLTMDGSQYITPNIAETNLFTAEYKIMRTQTETSNGHILSSNNTYYPCLMNKAVVGNYVLSKIKSGVTNFDDASWNINTAYTITFNMTTGAVTMNGTSIGTATIGSTASSSNKYYMFAYAGNGGANTHTLIGKAYYLKLFNSSGELVHEYVPAKRTSDNVCGMYDRVGNSFLTSATASQFGGEE